MHDAPPSYPLPFDETRRLQVLESLAILDTEPEPEFERLTWLAQRHFGTKFAFFSLVADNRQWFKSGCGLDVFETGRDVSFCAHAIMRDELLIVLDATRDGRFSDNPLVTGPPHIRFYAGAPIVVDGALIGSLCVIDDMPRDSFSDTDATALAAFGQIVQDAIRARQRTRAEVVSLEKQLKAERELANAAANAKRQFLDLIGHELRTPLNAVIGFADAISKECLGPVTPPGYREFAEQIVYSGHRQLQLIQRIIQLTADGRVELVEEVIDLRAHISQCVDAMTGDAVVKKIHLTATAPDLPVSLLADPIHVEQMLLELIGNAIKFLPENGHVSINHAVTPSGCIAITISDDGAGISDAAMETALGTFSQLSEGLGRLHEGAGIGLPIVKKLAELHGAEFSITSSKTNAANATIVFPGYRTIDHTASSQTSDAGDPQAL